LKGWRKNVEAIEYLRDFSFGPFSVLGGWTDKGAAREFRFD
jgi:hypothetical protein